MKKIISTNPSKNYEFIGEVFATTKEEIAEKVKRSKVAGKAWKNVSLQERVEYLKKLREILWDRRKEIANLITREMGMAITESEGEVEWDFDYFDWFLENVEKAISPEITLDDANGRYEIHYEPTGVSAVITPWNLPFDMFVWGVVPNLLVGNTVIYKASEECVLTGKLIEEISEEAGLPDGVLQFIHGDGEEGEYLVNQNIDLIWFTGSSEVGRKLFRTAGEEFIKSVMEMGGSNPAIVFEDADLSIVKNAIKFKRFAYCGQTCDAVKRLIVHETIFDEVVQIMKEVAENKKVGDPENPETEMGPLASRKQLELLESQIQDSVFVGAKIITGGERLGLGGAYYKPTILTNITPEMKVWREEVFGPALPIISFKTEEEAVKLANDTEYGLGSQIYTKDLEKARRVARKLETGGVDINGAGRFKPCNPFGGVKNSGKGREHGISGFRELCEIKMISIAK